MSVFQAMTSYYLEDLNRIQTSGATSLGFRIALQFDRSVSYVDPLHV